MLSVRYSCQSLIKLEFFQQVSGKFSNIKFHKKNRPVEAVFFHAERQTDRHDEANSSLSQFCERL
jgi:hypothetical protein